VKTPRPIIFDDIKKVLSELPDNSWLEEMFTRLSTLESVVYGGDSYILLEDGTIMLFEDGGNVLNESATGTLLYLEDGTPMLSETGAMLTLE